MTDRVQAFIVVLDQDIRTDDVEPIRAALMQVKHVISVEPQIATLQEHVARTRVRHELRDRIYEMLNEIFFPEKP